MLIHWDPIRLAAIRLVIWLDSDRIVARVANRS
jgi:hypothetical protein